MAELFKRGEQLFNQAKELEKTDPKQAAEIYGQADKNLNEFSKQKKTEQGFILWGDILTSQVQLEFKTLGIINENIKQKLSQASEKYMKALEENMSSFIAYLHWAQMSYNAASALLDVNKSEAESYLVLALEKLEEAVKLDPNNVEVYDTLGLVYNDMAKVRTGNDQLFCYARAEENMKEAAKIRAGSERVKKERPASSSQKLASAIQEKEKGNEYFKNGEFKRALEYYHRSLMYITGLFNLSKQEQEEVKVLQKTCNLNMAAVYLKNEHYDKCITSCTKVLAIEAANVKALFRRGVAYLRIKDYDRAEKDLKEASYQDPSDKGIQNELKLLVQKKHEQDKKLNKVFNKMMGGLDYADKPARGPTTEKKDEDDDAPATSFKKKEEKDPPRIEEVNE